MSDNDTPSNRRTDFSRRHLLAATAGTVALPIGYAAAAAPGSERMTAERPEHDRPENVARAYIEALNAGNRAAANEFIASRGELNQWSEQGFDWVDSFEIEFVRFETVSQHNGDVVADVEVTIAGNSGTVRYRFRETADGWMIWEAVDGLRTVQELDTSAKAVAKAYVTALNAGNREAVNELIVNNGDLSTWSVREFEWVSAFEFEFIDFQTVRTEDKDVIGDIELRIADKRRTVRYRFREIAAGNVKLWAAIGGIRTTGEVSAKAAGNAYITALDNADREKTNSLIAERGRLEPWSAQDFQWVRAFSIELVDFEATRRQDDSVIADLALRIGDSTEPVTYEFRQVDDGWKLWRSFGGIR